MAHLSKRRSDADNAPRDHYSEITAQIIVALEEGTPPWRRPWDVGKAGGPMMPHNAATGARYRGINTHHARHVAAGVHEQRSPLGNL